MSNCKITVKGFDVVLVLVEAVSIENSSDLVSDDGACFIDMQIYEERVEVAGNDDHLCLPVVKDRVVVLSVDADCSEKGKVG